MKNRGVIERTAARLNISEAQVEVIESQLWLAVRYYLSHPLEANGGILLNRFITFNPPSVKKIEWYLEKQGDSISEVEREFYLNYIKILQQ
jgi:hypothetical protein